MGVRHYDWDIYRLSREVERVTLDALEFEVRDLYAVTGLRRVGESTVCKEFTFSADYTVRCASVFPDPGGDGFLDASPEELADFNNVKDWLVFDNGTIVIDYYSVSVFASWLRSDGVNMTYEDDLTTCGKGVVFGADTVSLKDILDGASGVVDNVAMEDVVYCLLDEIEEYAPEELLD